MQLLHGITASTFRLKFFKLLFLITLSATILIGCERQFVPPIDPTNPSQTTAQLVQRALSYLADTAAELAFVELANAANDLSETLAVDDGTSVEPLFSKIAKLADAVTILEHAFSETGCKIELQNFAEASIDAVRAYTVRDADDMEMALHDIVEGAVSTEKILQQLPAGNAFIPFAFGYGLNIDLPEGNYYDIFRSNNYPPYKLGIISVWYDNKIRPTTETSTAVIEFLTDIGYKVTTEGVTTEGLNYNKETINLGSDVDPRLITNRLDDIPGVERALPHPIPVPDLPPWLVPPPPDSFIINRVRERYNVMWCHGNFDAINSILTDESELDFFDFAFLRNLVDIYAEEFPETANRIEMNQLSLRSIALEFLEIYFENSENTLDETIELFRQSVISGNIDIEHKTYDHYYLTTNYWKQLVTDLMNQ